MRTFFPGHQFFVSMIKITNRPGLVIDDKILDVANLTVFGLDVMSHSQRQCCAGADPILSYPVAWILSIYPVHAQYRDKPPHFWAAPIHRPSIITIIVLLELL
jgi:hypothetical protein